MFIHNKHTCWCSNKGSSRKTVVANQQSKQSHIYGTNLHIGVVKVKGSREKGSGWYARGVLKGV